MILKSLERLSDRGQDQLLDWLRLRSRSAQSARPVAPRLIVTASESFDARVPSGGLRAELAQQLGNWPIDLAPLSSRPLDVGLLCADYCSQRPGYRIDPTVMWRLLTYHWPDNVRELKAHLEALYVGERDGAPMRPEAPLPVKESAMLRRFTPSSVAQARLTRDELVHLLDAHGYAIAPVAYACGIPVMALYMWLEQWKLEIEPHHLGLGAHA